MLRGTEKNRKHLRAWAAMLLGLLIVPSAARTLDDAIPTLLQAALGHADTLRIDAATLPASDYRPVYEALSYQPLWVESSGLNARARDALKAIEAAGEHGLSSSRYGLATIYALQNTHSLTHEDSAKGLAAMDLLVSHAIVSYARDLGHGATAPTRKLLKGFSASVSDAGRLLEAAYMADDIEEFFESREPKSREYAALKSLLKDYKALVAKGGWRSFSAGKAIRPGESDGRIPDLRALLSAMKDFDGDLASTHYDEKLQKAVLRFQTRHGLNADGIVSAGTQKALAVPVEERIEQINVTMERLRWMPENLGGKYVVVNLPAFDLHAYEDGKEALAMRVIVGKPQNRTTQFSNQITDVVFNPTWSPTPSIIRNEMIPKLRNNPEYFVRAGFTVYQDGEPVDPMNVDVENGGRFHFRQSAGRGNALGKIKFNLPDTDDIYMHSTANPELFAKETRALSHGCVRLEKPQALAHFVMDGMEGWSTDKVDTAYSSSATRHVPVKPTAVHFVYWTAWVGEDGTPHFYNDIYRQDAGLMAKLTPKEKATFSIAKR